MGIHTADAIVLRQYPYRETSALVTCLTDRFGKLKGLIKGLRDAQRPRYRSAMEPLSLNRIVFYDIRTSTLHLISQCDLLESFQGLTADLDTMRLAAACAELTDTVVESGDPQPLTFWLLHSTLARLATRPAHPAPVYIHFVLRLLRLAGFHPQLDECTSCGQHPLGHEAFWSARQGGLLCGGCLHEDPRAHTLEAATLEVLSSCAEADEPLELGRGQALAIQRRLDEFLRWRLERPLKTISALR